MEHVVSYSWLPPPQRKGSLIWYFSFMQLKSCCMLSAWVFCLSMNQLHVHHHHDQPRQPGDSLAPSVDMAYSYGPSPKLSLWDHSTEPVYK